MPHSRKKKYPIHKKGFVIDSYKGFQAMYDVAHAGVNKKKTRKVAGVIVTYPDSDATKIFDSLKEAEEYIDRY
jgi:hypothetical protein